jgi:hypothetical protein
MSKLIAGIMLAVLMVGGIVSCSSNACQPAPMNMKGEG